MPLETSFVSQGYQEWQPEEFEVLDYFSFDEIAKAVSEKTGLLEEMTEYKKTLNGRGLIEGRSDIDGRKLIKPYSEIMSMDPLHSLVFNALGSHNLNQKTSLLIPLVNDEQNLGGIYQTLQAIDIAQFTELLAKRDAAIKADKEATGGEKHDKIVAETEKTARNTLLTRNLLNSNAEIVIGNINNLTYQLSPENIATLEQQFWTCLSNPEVKKLTIDTLLSLFNSKAAENLIDLNNFSSLAEVGGKLDELLTKRLSAQLAADATGVSVDQLDKEKRAQLTNQIKDNFSLEEFKTLLGNETINLALLLLYLGLNNRQRASQSKELKRDLDQIFNQAQYKKISKNPTLDYIQGKLPISPEAEEQIKVVLIAAGYERVKDVLVERLMGGGGSESGSDGGWVVTGF